MAVYSYYSSILPFFNNSKYYYLCRYIYLYSPTDADTWYFIPWDYDKALGAYSENRPIWQRGVSNLWGNTLVNRFLRNTDNKNELTQKIEELKNIISQVKLDYFIELYKPIAVRFLTNEPDNSMKELDLDDINEEFDLLKGSIGLNVNEYYKSLERPMPVFLYPPNLNGNFMEFDWSQSYDFQEDPLYYHFQLSDSPLFENILYEEDNLLNNELIIRRLPPGHYYYRIYIRDSHGNTSDAFDIYFDDETQTYCYGVRDFYVN